jgi:hypothetical protein
MRHALSLGSLLVAAFLALSLLHVQGHPPGIAALAPPSGGAGLEDFMLVVHGPKGLRTQIQESIAGSGPADDKAWKMVKARAAVIVSLVDSILLKANPERGDKASWKAKTAEYEKIARALLDACSEQSSSGIKAELAKMLKSCQACHKAHQ